MDYSHSWTIEDIAVAAIVRSKTDSLDSIYESCVYYVDNRYTINNAELIDGINAAIMVDDGCPYQAFLEKSGRNFAQMLRRQKQLINESFQLTTEKDVIDNAMKQVEIIQRVRGE